MELTVISTFAGGGGSSLGYKWAGFKELLAIEWDKNAAETLRLNFDFPVWRRDIRKIEAAEILNFCKIKKGELDILDGSPPCQGFSMAGKRKVTDERNDLFLDFARLIDGIQPKVFVMENVPGMIQGKMKGVFIEIIKTLKGLNYKVKVKLMNSMYYGVPQSRQRLIFIGVRNDLGIEPSFPEPSNKIITVKEALKGLPEDTHRDGNKMFKTLWKKTGYGESFSKKHPKGHWFNKIKIHPNRPAPTIIKMVIINGGAGLTHWKYPRHLNIAELKRLSSFPDDYKFVGTFEQQWARIGNAVMPKFMQAIAEHIKTNILLKQ